MWCQDRNQNLLPEPPPGGGGFFEPKVQLSTSLLVNEGSTSLLANGHMATEWGSTDHFNLLHWGSGTERQGPPLCRMRPLGLATPLPTAGPAPRCALCTPPPAGPTPHRTQCTPPGALHGHTFACRPPHPGTTHIFFCLKNSQ